jgi:hypothetical protein
MVSVEEVLLLLLLPTAGRITVRTPKCLRNAHMKIGIN